MPEVAVRFAVGDGSLRASTWKCWSLVGNGKSDFYVACRELGMALKVSFHQSGEWHYGFVKRFLDEQANPGDWPVRIVERWRRPDRLPGTGMTQALRILTMPSAVSVPIDHSVNVHWIPAPTPEGATEIVICIADPGAVITGWPGSRTGMAPVESLNLDNGETVWILYRQVEKPAFVPQPVDRVRYFKGKTLADAAGPHVRALAFSRLADGVRVLVDGKGLLTAPDAP